MRCLGQLYRASTLLPDLLLWSPNSPGLNNQVRHVTIAVHNVPFPVTGLARGQYPQLGGARIHHVEGLSEDTMARTQSTAVLQGRLAPRSGLQLRQTLQHWVQLLQDPPWQAQIVAALCGSQWQLSTLPVGGHIDLSAICRAARYCHGRQLAAPGRVLGCHFILFAT